MHKVTLEIDHVITKAANGVVSNGGSFYQTRNETVQKISMKYPGLNVKRMMQGFHKRYKQALRKCVA